MRIILTDSGTVAHNGDLSLTPLEQFGTVTKFDYTAPEEAAQRIISANADIVLANKTLITRAVIEQAKCLKYIGLFATGFNNVDIAAAKEHGIPVCNSPGYSTEAVAQHTFALMLELFNRTGDYSRIARGDWANSKTFAMFTLPTFELAGKTLGIIGYGTIGRRVSEIAAAFGMNTLLYTRTPPNGRDPRFVGLDELLSRADVISLHCPLNQDTDKLLNADRIAAMKKTAVIINTARGGIIDERALADALNTGKISGAAVDVVSVEPIKADNPLLTAKNCVITPHIAWGGLETRERLMSVVCDNIAHFLAKDIINNVAV